MRDSMVRNVCEEAREDLADGNFPYWAEWYSGDFGHDCPYCPDGCSYVVSVANAGRVSRCKEEEESIYLSEGLLLGGSVD